MSLKKFKLVQDYPGSPEVGYTINSGNSMYYSYRPESYPHLWVEIKCEKTITTYDGVELGLGDEYFWIYEYEQIRSDRVSEYGIQCDLERDKKIFSTKRAAEEYLNNSIRLDLVDGKLLGENILIYGVCDGSFQLAEMNSLKLHKKIYSNKTTGHISNKWKWFKSKDERDKYVTYNKPIFSLEYLFGRFCFDADMSNALLLESHFLMNK